MTRIIEVIPEEMTEKSFEPFGYLWNEVNKPKTHRLLEPVKFECDGRTIVSTIWQPNEGRTFCNMERHSAVTQGFVQLSGCKSVIRMIHQSQHWAGLATVDDLPPVSSNQTKAFPMVRYPRS